MQIQQSGLANSKTFIYPVYFSTKDTAKGFLKYNYLNSEYYKVNPDIREYKETITKYDRQNFSMLGFKFTHSDAVLLILLALISLVAYVKISGKDYIHKLAFSITSDSYSSSFCKEKNLSLKFNGYILALIFFVSLGFFVTIFFDIFNPKVIENYWFTSVLIFSLIIFALYIVQYIAFLSFGFVFSQFKIADEYMFFVSNLVKLAGIAYIFLIFATFFADPEIKKYFIYIAIAFSFLLYFVKIFRALVTFFRNGFSLFYMFLYFCALEIIPVLLLVKILLILIELDYDIIKFII
ncbi:MAG: DUF4271 domain-containing protein [Bacteroidales bacterium]|nr:DUF4271 domain-containing protein [Bacteroidales bacterium]MBN2758174.1 DUF4271 domain-containing protein [Bacteroidales bacterium]